MTNSEKKWAKENGLKKTNLRTMVRGNERVVWRSNDGSLYYRDRNHYCGTFEIYCYVSYDVH